MKVFRPYYFYCRVLNSTTIKTRSLAGAGNRISFAATYSAHYHEITLLSETATHWHELPTVNMQLLPFSKQSSSGK